MTMADLDAWFELFDWANEPNGDDATTMSASESERAFFHL